MAQRVAGIRQQVGPWGPLRWDYSGAGVTVEVDQDAMSDHPDGPAYVTISDWANRMIYGIGAVEDERGRARLVAYSTSPVEDEDYTPAWPYPPSGRHFVDDRPLRSFAWLARVALECARGVSDPVETDEAAELRRIADTVRRCERDGVNATTLLADQLHLSPRTVSRRISEAAAAGFLPERKRGRPRKSLTPEEDDSNG